MKRFTRTIEDFTCLNCGLEVPGSGYTNHCPNCLWSRHVDTHPGDRAGDCGGAMEPVQVETKSNHSVLVTRCVACGHVHRNRTSPGDSSEALVEIAEKFSAAVARTSRA